MCVLFFRKINRSARYNMQMGFGSDEEPGMSAIMEGFGNGIKSDDIVIEIRTDLQILYIKGDMIEPGISNLGR